MIMSPGRCPEDLVLTVEDFSSCGWKNALARAAGEGYPSMSEAFSTSARQTTDKAHSKVLNLLASACSMVLSPDSFNEPFKPFFEFSGGRSIIPNDFLEADIAFFVLIVDEIDDSWLKARLADLIWFIQSPPNFKFALKAIDSYRSIPLDKETWVHGQQCWQRAIGLARLLGKGAGERLAEMETSIIKTFASVTRQDGFLGYQLSDLLKSNDLGRDSSTMIAPKLKSLACEFESESDLYSAREYFGASAYWFKADRDDEMSNAMTVAVAKCWAKEANVAVASVPPSHTVAKNFYEKAIQTYRTIPKSMREPHQVGERIVELQKQLNESGEQSLDEMCVIRTGDIDMTKLAENACNAVRCKAPVEALKAFVNLYSGANAKELRITAKNDFRRFPVQTLMPTTIRSHDGRVIAKLPGIDLNDPLSDDNEKVINFRMIFHYSFHVGIAVSGYILPALEILLLEHRLREADFIRLAKQSPIVPIGREIFFGKALFTGYDRDYGTALHLLVPQIEHMVRFHLKQAGVKTTNLDTNGIENEISLNSLMDLPQAKEIFDADIGFEIKALFCDPCGPNLRNELAHGLLDDVKCQQGNAIYAWWFGLKLVFITFWNSLRNAVEGSEQGDQQ